MCCVLRQIWVRLLVEERSTKIHLLTRSRGVGFCHARICKPQWGVRCGPPGRADVVSAVRVGRRRFGAHSHGTAAAAGAALARGGVFRARPGAVSRARLSAGLGQADGRSARAGGAMPVGEGAARSAPSPRACAVQDAVRGAGRSAGAATHAGCAFRRFAHRGLRRVQLIESSRHRRQPVLAGADPVPDGICRIPDRGADDPGRNRHPGADRGDPGLGRRPGRTRLGAAAARAAATRHAGAARSGFRLQYVTGQSSTGCRCA